MNVINVHGEKVKITDKITLHWQRRIVGVSCRADGDSWSWVYWGASK